MGGWWYIFVSPELVDDILMLRKHLVQDLGWLVSRHFLQRYNFQLEAQLRQVFRCQGIIMHHNHEQENVDCGSFIGGKAPEKAEALHLWL